MYSNFAYLNNSILPFADNENDLVVGSCGHYRFSGEECFHTIRLEGREDYQLLYVASGSACFVLDGEKQFLPAGTMVLYRPFQMQDYCYYGEDKPEVFWVHFTGKEVENILQCHKIEGPYIESGCSDVYRQMFLQMIHELQTCRVSFAEQLDICLRQIFIQLQRCGNRIAQPHPRREMEEAVQYFQQHHTEQIHIEAYASSRGMSVSWFLRCFKEYTGQSPARYITGVRINNAVNMLENTNCTIAQIGAMVGYENPLYFSRIFRKYKGVSPREYRAGR